MPDYKKICISPEDSIRKALEILQESAMRLVLVINKENQLVGVVSDGDIRRAILSNIPLSNPATEIMNSNPITVTKNTPKEQILKLFRENLITRIPVVDDENRVQELLSVESVFQIVSHKNPIILMAGGLGSRLSPLTDDVPKPMLNVGGQPILETILKNCASLGFDNFYISVNYKAEKIKEHFGDGSKWGVKITYLEETKRLGTAGSIKLFKEECDLPLIVMNGDLLTKINLGSLLEYHQNSESIATMCVKEFDFQIPYGVVRENQGQVVALEEKPVHTFLVNAGIYALSPEVLKYIPENEYFDMTQLFSALVNHQKKTMVFPIHEYWLDIGKIQDYEKAQLEFCSKF